MYTAPPACQQKKDEYLHRPAFNNGSSVNENNLSSGFVVGVWMQILLTNVQNFMKFKNPHNWLCVDVSKAFDS